MANKASLPTIETITALSNFSSWLIRSMAQSDITCEELAEAVGVNRKSVIAWRNCQRFPKLDHLVKVYKFFGYEWVSIPFTKETELPTNSGGVR